MILRVDVTYPQGCVHAKEFPLDAATLFQASVAANAHRLDGARPALLALEQSECLRIEAADTDRTSVTTSCPRLPKISEIKAKFAYKRTTHLMVSQRAFHFAGDGTHLRYYFKGQFTPEMLTYFQPFRVGHGESLCISKATLLDSMPAKAKGMAAWEPARLGHGRQMRVLRPGLLDDLCLFHDNKLSSHGVEHNVALFSTESRVQTLLYRFYKDGKEYGFHQWELSAVAGMLRHAVMSQVPSGLKEYVSNHGKTQVQYLPLGTVGFEYCDRKIRRAVIVDPLASLPLHRVSELKMSSLDGRRFIAVRQTETDNVFDKYLAESRRWVSATPVLLSGHDTRRGKKDNRKLQKMLVKELGVVGLKPKSVMTFPMFPMFVDAGRKHNKTYQQVGLAVEFDEPVVGTMVVGAGRNFGLGVLAAV